MNSTKSFDNLVQEGLTLAFSGWDFSKIGERWVSSPTSWDFGALVKQRISNVQRLLDMDTGGGEFLSSLAPLPLQTYATEAYPPNILDAQQRLEPLGVHVISDYTDDNLPFDSGFFELVINRHGSFQANELYRILHSDGIFLTQQVGSENNIRLNHLLQDTPSYEYSYWTLKESTRRLREAGFQIIQSRQEYPVEVFYDIGAVVYYLRIISWQVADFSVEKYRQKLLAIHTLIQREGKLVTHGHRFLIEAIKE